MRFQYLKYLLLAFSLFAVAGNFLFPAVGHSQTVSDLQKQTEENYIKLTSPEYKERYQAIWFFAMQGKVPDKVLAQIADLYLKEAEAYRKVQKYLNDPSFGHEVDFKTRVPPRIALRPGRIDLFRSRRRMGLPLIDGADFAKVMQRRLSGYCHSDR